MAAVRIVELLNDDATAMRERRILPTGRLLASAPRRRRAAQPAEDGPSVPGGGRKRGLAQAVVHTGQHHDDALSAALFRDLERPRPDVKLEVGSHSHAVQTALVIERLEPIVGGKAPGLAGASTATSTRHRRGTRGGQARRTERTRRGGASKRRPAMPEEIDRIVADRLASLAPDAVPGCGC